ncbi:MAG: DNA cytosine methyltransferase [Infirmifilum sp.]
MVRFRAVSLFSGAGGLDWGFKEAGFDIVFANDVLGHMTKTYSLNFGLKHVTCSRQPCVAERGVVLQASVEHVDFSGLAGEDVDVLVGGPPCQDFSIVRGPSRSGIEVRRGRLYAHFVRALITLQPKAFVFENVPGLVSTDNGLAYNVILEDLRNLKTRWREVRAVINTGNNSHNIQGYEIISSDFVEMTRLGLPQMRKRLIIIGVRKDLIPETSTDFLQSGLYGLYLKLNKKLMGEEDVLAKYPLTPIETFEGDILPNLQGIYEDVMKEYEGVWEEVKTPRALKWKREVWDKLTFDIVKDYIFMNGIRVASEEELEQAFRRHREVLEELGYYRRSVKNLIFPDGSNSRPNEQPSVVERLKRIPPGENHEFVRGTKWEVKGLMSNIYRRAHPLMPAPTVIAYGGGGTWGYHYEGGRGMLSNRERARLQSFPDTFLFTGTWSQVRAQIGEAVPPLVAKRIAQAVIHLLKTLE